MSTAFEVIESDDGSATIYRIASRPGRIASQGQALNVPAEHRRAVALALMGQPDEAMIERVRQALTEDIDGTDDYVRRCAKRAIAAIFGGEQE